MVQVAGKDPYSVPFLGIADQRVDMPDRTSLEFPCDLETGEVMAAPDTDWMTLRVPRVFGNVGHPRSASADAPAQGARLGRYLHSF